MREKQHKESIPLSNSFPLKYAINLMYIQKNDILAVQGRVLNIGLDDFINFELQLESSVNYNDLLVPRRFSMLKSKVYNTIL